MYIYTMELEEKLHKPKFSILLKYIYDPLLFLDHTLSSVLGDHHFAWVPFLLECGLTTLGSLSTTECHKITLLDCMYVCMCML